MKARHCNSRTPRTKPLGYTSSWMMRGLPQIRRYLCCVETTAKGSFSDCCLATKQAEEKETFFSDSRVPTSYPDVFPKQEIEELPPPQLLSSLSLSKL